MSETEIERGRGGEIEIEKGSGVEIKSGIGIEIEIENVVDGVVDLLAFPLLREWSVAVVVISVSALRVITHTSLRLIRLSNTIHTLLILLSSIDTGTGTPTGVTSSCSYGLSDPIAGDFD